MGFQTPVMLLAAVALLMLNVCAKDQEEPEVPCFQESFLLWAGATERTFHSWIQPRGAGCLTSGHGPTKWAKNSYSFCMKIWGEKHKLLK